MNNFVKLIKIALLIKVIFLIVMTALQFGWISFGEKSIQAEVSDEKPMQSEPDKMPDSEENKSTRTIASNTKKQSADTSTGFLESLLTLPPLDVEKSSKDEIGRYLTMIEQAKQQVEDRITTLKSRHGAIKNLEEKIDQKLKLLDQERQYFSRTIQQEKKIQKERLDTLVDFYGKMEPKKAAPVFETMDKDLVVSLFKNMKKKQVTRIMELMDTQKSVDITEYFGRIGSAKEYDLLKEMNQSLRLAFNDCKTPPVR